MGGGGREMSEAYGPLRGWSAALNTDQWSVEWLHVRVVRGSQKALATEYCISIPA